MPETVTAQIARLEALLGTVREDVNELRADRRKLDRRLRAVEDAMRITADRHEIAELRSHQSARRIELRLQVLTVVIAVAAILAPIILVIAHN